ncbi:19989_t:CDS:2 [Entrophospora sp. SA101]|nr:19989_t:CDS:2 [Entrophospora sp. SA101]
MACKTITKTSLFTSSNNKNNKTTTLSLTLTPSLNEREINVRLTKIFTKIGQLDIAQQGIQDLHDFLIEYPECDVKVNAFEITTREMKARGMIQQDSTDNVAIANNSSNNIKSGIQDLHDFLIEYPECDVKVNAFLASAGTFFHKYINKRLAEITTREMKARGMIQQDSTDNVAIANNSSNNIKSVTSTTTIPASSIISSIKKSTPLSISKKPKLHKINTSRFSSSSTSSNVSSRNGGDSDTSSPYSSSGEYTPPSSPETASSPTLLSSRMSREFKEKYCSVGGDDLPLPDLNTENPSVASELNKWIKWLVSEFNFDGIRIDTVRHIPHSFWSGFAKSSGVFSIGEILDGDPRIVASYQGLIDSTLGYPLYFKISYLFINPGANMYEIRDVINNDRNFFKDTSVLGNFIDCHDKPRLQHLTSDQVLIRNVLTFVLLFDGIPIVYQGTEQGFSGPPTGSKIGVIIKHTLSLLH